MHILFLAHFYPPEMGGAGARLHGLARMLVQSGHHVTVITGFPNYPEGRIYDGYRRRFFDQRIVDGVNVVRTLVYASPKKGALRRLANYGSFVITSAIAGLRLSEKFDIVFASSPPLFLGLSGLFLARRFGCPFVFDIRDIWPELAVEAGEFTPDAAIVRLGEKLETFLYRHADHITVVTERKRQKLYEKGVATSKLSVVANGVDLDRLAESQVDWRKKLGLENKFVALYAGLIGVFQGVDIIVKAAQLLADEGNKNSSGDNSRDNAKAKNIHFVIVGEGVKRPEIEEAVTSNGLTNVSILPPQPREEIPAMLRSFDLALVPLVNEQLVDAVPSKLLEAMGCQCPVILIAGGESSRIMTDAEAGIVVPPNSVPELAEALAKFSELPSSKRQHYAQSGFNYILLHHDRARLAEQLEDVFQTVVAVSTK